MRLRSGTGATTETMAMKHVQVAAIALGILVAATAAQAEIICTNRGCWETGGRIYRHGGVLVGLPYVNNRDDGRAQKRVQRIIRETW